MKKIFQIILLFSIILFTGCTNQTEKEAYQASRISGNGHESACPYLTEDHKGNPVLCWVESKGNSEEYLLNYAVSFDAGKTFSAPKKIPTTSGIYPHDENLSKILFKQNGDIMAMFAVSNPNTENSYAGLVFYTQSFNNGKSWSAPRQLAQNTLNSIDERYFDITLLPNGEIAAVWLDSRKDNDLEGSSLYYSSTRGRAGFDGEKVIGKQLCQCCRTDLYVDEKNNLHVAYRAIINGSIRDMVHMVSQDNGENFSAPERISADNWVINGCPHTGPTMASNKSGMHFAWFTMGGGNGVYYANKLDGKPFSARQTVSSMTSAKHPQMTTLSNGNVAIVWDEQVQIAGNINNRIGVQTRNESESTQIAYLTPDSSSATHPVLLPVNDSHILVSYTKKSEQSSEVWYKLVDINKLTEKK